MGFLDKIKDANEHRAAEKRNERELSAYNIAFENWAATKLVEERILTAFKAIQSGRDAIQSNSITKKGEFAIWSGACSLHESKRQAGQFVGRSQGVSIPLGHSGIRYRTGVTKGTFVQGNEIQTTVDTGIVILSTTRILFTGRLKTQEWAFAKWAGADTSSDEATFLFHVSNRQKVSGIQFQNTLVGQEFNRFLGVTLELDRYGIDQIVSSIEKTLNDHELTMPSNPSPLQAT